MKKKPTYRIIVERAFAEEGKTLEELYLDYMAEKIAEMVRDIQNEVESINTNNAVRV